MNETKHTFIPLSHSLNHEGGKKYKNKKSGGGFTIGLFLKWKHWLSLPWTCQLFDSSSYGWVLSFLGFVPIIWVRDNPTIGYFSSHYGECFNSSYIVSLYSSSSCVSLPSHHCVMLYVQQNFKPELAICCFVDFLS
jgi:hypothetical protein